MKCPQTCPFCKAEQGIYESWSMNPQAMGELKQKHLKEHCQKCPTCGQPIKTNI